MRIVDQAVYVGPSLYAHFPVIRLDVDLGELEHWPSARLGPKFTDGLIAALPGLHEHGCSYGEPGGFIRRLHDGTWFGHITGPNYAVQGNILAGENVPAGAYANLIINSAAREYGESFAKDVRDSIVSHETHVRQTLQKVVLGEADAALVYKTDAASAGDQVVTIAIPPEHNVLATYPIATLTGAQRAHLGDLFIDYLLSQPGQERLIEFGFAPASNETKE